MATKFRSFCFKRAVPGSEVINHYSTQTLSDEFGWLVPIQDMLNNINNNFNITMYAYAYESVWEDGFYFAQPDDAGNFIRVCDYTRTYDSTSGLNTFNVSNQDLKAGINSQSYFLDDLINRGYTNVFVHPAAFQYYKFNQDPTADFVYGISSSTIIRPITILENIPDPPPPTIPVVLMPDGKYWTDTNLAIDDGLGDITVVNSNTYTSDYGLNQMGDQYFYTYDAAVRVAASISGFHLPSQSEMYGLISSCYSEHPDDFTYALRTSYNWYDSNGTDLYGFKLFGAGGYTQSNVFLGAGQHAYLWTSNSIGTVADVDIDNPNSVSINTVSLAFGPKYSVRLIKD